MGSKKMSLGEKCTVAAVFVALTWLFFKYLLPPSIPIILACMLSSFMRPLVSFVCRKTKMPPKVCGGVLVALMIFAVGYTAISLGEKLLREASDFLAVTVSELEGEDNIIKRIRDILESLPDKFPLLRRFASKDSDLSERAYEFVVSAAREAAGHLSASLTSVAAGFLKSLPAFVFSLIVSILALFYLTVDAVGVKSGVKQLLPKRLQSTVKNLYEGISIGVAGYARAYFVLMLLIFSTAFFGLIIMNVRYAFFLAIVIAVVDALPLLGSGSITLPWAVFSLITKSTSRGVGLLILTAVMYLIRQLAESRLVGHFLGIHPLITLISAYLGFSFFGFYGMIVAPICLYVLRLIFSDSTVSEPAKENGTEIQ